MTPRGGLSKKNPLVCPKCGTRASEPVKTWTLVSPIPDRKGRITVTVMGSFVCPNCGHSWRGVVQKIKTEASEPLEEEGERGEGEIIEIDLSELDRLD